MPKILRIYFLFNRNLLKELSRISWETVKEYYRSTCRKEGANSAADLGHYSNVTRGRLKKEDGQPEYHIIEDESPGGLNRSWARLIQKIYEVDPLTCPRCGEKMKIIAFIEDYKVVRKILDHLGIYEFERKRSPPRIEFTPDEFDDYTRDDYIDCDHVC